MKRDILSFADMTADDLNDLFEIARSQDPNSASCQFYICLDSLPHLDGNYTVFGQVVKGIGVVEKIKQGDVMRSVKMETKDYDEIKTLLKGPTKNPLENVIYTLPVAKK